MKARWIGEGDGRKLVGRKEAETNKGKGATKIEPKKQNENNIRDNNTPLENPRIAGKTALVVIISKQDNRQKQKKRQINQKNRNKEHNNNQDSNNRKTRRPKMQESWVWNGDAMEMALKESHETEER